jgi:hypothetical protein
VLRPFTRPQFEIIPSRNQALWLKRTLVGPS